MLLGRSFMDFAPRFFLTSSCSSSACTVFDDLPASGTTGAMEKRAALNVAKRIGFRPSLLG